MEFRALKLIVPHLGWPYVDEAVMLAVKYEGVHLDTSALYGGSPSDTLRHLLIDHIGKHVVESALHRRLLFGSNYPRVDIRRCARALGALEVSDSVKENLSRGNAIRLLGLETP